MYSVGLKKRETSSFVSFVLMGSILSVPQIQEGHSERRSAATP